MNALIHFYKVYLFALFSIKPWFKLEQGVKRNVFEFFRNFWVDLYEAITNKRLIIITRVLSVPKLHVIVCKFSAVVGHFDATV